MALRARRLSRSAEVSTCLCHSRRPHRHVDSLRLWPSRRASSDEGEDGVFAASRAAPLAADSPHVLHRRRREPPASGAAARTGTGRGESPLSPASAGCSGTVTSRNGYAVSELRGAEKVSGANGVEVGLSPSSSVILTSSDQPEGRQTVAQGVSPGRRRARHVKPRQGRQKPTRWRCAASVPHLFRP